MQTATVTKPVARDEEIEEVEPPVERTEEQQDILDATDDLLDKIDDVIDEGIQNRREIQANLVYQAMEDMQEQVETVGFVLLPCGC